MKTLSPTSMSDFCDRFSVLFIEMSLSEVFEHGVGGILASNGDIGALDLCVQYSSLFHRA